MPAPQPFGFGGLFQFSNHSLVAKVSATASERSQERNPLAFISVLLSSNQSLFARHFCFAALMSDARSSSSGIEPPSTNQSFKSPYISARRFHGPARLG